MNYLINLLSKVIDAVGNLCSLLMILMIFNVFYDVIMRYFFNDVSIGLQELEWHLFATMFMFGIGYTLKEDGHVRVDVLYDQFSQKTKAIINLIGSITLALPITVLVLYYGWGYTHDAYVMNEGSADPGGLPNRWIIRGMIPASSIYLIICIIYVVLKQINELTQLDINPEQKQ